MSAEEKQSEVTPACDLEELEERREARKLKSWLVRALATTVMIVSGTSTLALLYAAVIQEKDLNTGFIGEVLKTVFDFLRFILA